MPFWVAAELVFVAENWHMPPDVWLRQDARIRASMLKYNRLRGEARTRYKSSGVDDDVPSALPPVNIKRF